MDELFPNDLDAWVAEHPNTYWITIPYSEYFSKNALFGYSPRTHKKFILREPRKAREDLTLLIKSDLRSRAFKPKTKVWLDILVAKKQHIGDAINFLDSIADCVKVAIDVDDRYFSIRRIDWAIDKENPRIIIGISQ